MNNSEKRKATAEVVEAARDILNSVKSTKIRKNSFGRRPDGVPACASKDEYLKADLIRVDGRIHVRFADGTVDLTPVSSLQKALEIVGRKSGDKKTI